VNDSVKVAAISMYARPWDRPETPIGSRLSWTVSSSRTRSSFRRRPRRCAGSPSRSTAVRAPFQAACSETADMSLFRDGRARR
jgi:hypothetical protein